jgi:hypothetical protein
MILDANYHTALTETHWVLGAKRAETPHGVAFVHDIFDGYDIRYDDCDVLYTDIPMACGFDVFERRAQSAGRTYFEFLWNAGNFIQRAKKPAVILGGKIAAEFFGDAAVACKSKLNGLPVFAICFNLQLSKAKNEFDVLDELATRFDCIGDFCCGYGRAGRVFAKHGKRFVMSDLNDACIGHIAKNWGHGENTME